MIKFLARVFWLVACSMIIVGCNTTGPTPDGSAPKPIKPELIGLADFHTHEFGYLGFGGQWSSHSIDPKTGCLPLLTYDATTLRIKDLVRSTILGEATYQATRGQCNPSGASNFASQRMDTDNLHRAWLYGLRLIVVFAVSNEFLCDIGELASPCPSDRDAIDQQLKAAKDLEAAIDNESGGPGTGWYRIVYDPEQARQVISKGKLAVVLGVETSNAFGGCSFKPSGTVPAIMSGPPETTWSLDCGDRNAGPDSLQSQQALALFEHYWDLGARHFFPIHNMDGIAGGAALFSPIIHAIHNPSRLNEAFNSNPDLASKIDNLILAIRPPVQAWDCSSRFEFDGGRCNELGLTETGRYLIKLMASYGAMIDVDHMSWKAKRELLSNNGLLGGVYPFISSHTGIQAINHGDENNEGQLAPEDVDAVIKGGGAFGPILPPVVSVSQEDTYPKNASIALYKCGGTSEAWVQAYRYIVDNLKDPNHKLLNGQMPYLGIGFGTDFGAPVPVAAYPRFEGDLQVTAIESSQPSLLGALAPSSKPIEHGPCYKTGGSSTTNATEPHVNYPFTSPLDSSLKFDKSTTPWGGQYPAGSAPKSYDISFDGVVHEGVIPDFVEELHSLGLTDADLQPLWHGAEAYVRAWENSTALQGPNFNPEYTRGIVEKCRTIRAGLVNIQLVQPSSYQAILVQLRQTGCFGFPWPPPTEAPTPDFPIISFQPYVQVVDNVKFINPQLNSTLPLEIQNHGDMPAIINNITFENGTLFQVTGSTLFPLRIDSGKKMEVAIGLKQLPPEGAYSDGLHVLSNDPQNPDIRIVVHLTIFHPKPGVEKP